MFLLLAWGHWMCLRTSSNKGVGHWAPWVCFVPIGVTSCSPKNMACGSGNGCSTSWLVLITYVVCVIWVTQVKGQQQTSLFISVLWVIYSLLILGSFLWLNFKDIRFHVAVQRRENQTDNAARAATYGQSVCKVVAGASDETIADQ